MSRHARHERLSQHYHNKINAKQLVHLSLISAKSLKPITLPQVPSSGHTQHCKDLTCHIRLSTIAFFTGFEYITQMFR